MNPAPANSEVKYVVCRFEEAERYGEFVCRRPSPRGPWVFARELYVQNERWPKRGHSYIVAITGKTQSGRADRGRIVASLPVIRQNLHEELRKATWQRQQVDGGHCFTRVVGRFMNTAYGRFEPIYDNGQRSNGADVEPSIVLKPVDGLYYGEVLRECSEHFVYYDELALAPVRQATVAKVTLVEYLREQQNT